MDRNAEAMALPSGTTSGSPSVNGLSDDEMSKKTKAVMDEFHHINDVKVCIITFVVQDFDFNVLLPLVHSI